MTDSHGGSPLILGGRVRRLTTVDIESVLRIVDLEELDAAALRRELTCGDDYLWAGIDLPNGSLGAVHRSMTWGNHLLLKGVFVDEVLRGSGAALELAFALRDAARGGGHSGLAAWVEPHKPEAALARMLRLRPTGPLVHRFEVPVAADGPRAAASVRSCGRITMALPRLAAQVPLVADLLTGDSPAAIQWVHDRHRLVLSGFPPHPSPTSSFLSRQRLLWPEPMVRGIWNFLPLPQICQLRCSWLQSRPAGSVGHPYSSDGRTS